VQAGVAEEQFVQKQGASKDGVARVIYESKDGNTSKTFSALDFPGQENVVFCRNIILPRI